MTDASKMQEVVVCDYDDLPDPGCREFSIGEGEWPFRGFVVHKNGELYAYQNYCMHAGHRLNWKPDQFLTSNNDLIICASHGAVYDIESGQCTDGPCVGKSLNRVEVRVADGNVIVTGPDGLR